MWDAGPCRHRRAHPGQVASLGGQQLGWAQLFVSRWNRFHKLKVTLVQGDTQLPDQPPHCEAAQQLAGGSQVLGVVGPAGSQEVIVSSPPFKSRGLGSSRARPHARR